MAGAPKWRPPESYVHGLDGGCVIVPARVAAWLDRYADLRRVRTEHRGADAEVDAVLVALGVAGAHWSSAAGGSDARKPAEAEPPLGWLTTQQVADQVGITARAVRHAISAGRVNAELVDRGWRISRDDFEHYRAARAA